MSERIKTEILYFAFVGSSSPDGTSLDLQPNVWRQKWLTGIVEVELSDFVFVEEWEIPVLEPCHGQKCWNSSLSFLFLEPLSIITGKKICSTIFLLTFIYINRSRVQKSSPLAITVDLWLRPSCHYALAKINNAVCEQKLLEMYHPKQQDSCENMFLDIEC